MTTTFLVKLDGLFDGKNRSIARFSLTILGEMPDRLPGAHPITSFGEVFRQSLVEAGVQLYLTGAAVAPIFQAGELTPIAELRRA